MLTTDDEEVSSTAIRGVPRTDVRVSVIIPHRDTPAALARCLAALDNQRADIAWETIVIDGSRETPTWVRNRARTMLLADRGEGPGPARNIGVEAARGEILAFIDADCRPNPDWLRTIDEAFAEHPGAGAIAGRVEVTPCQGEGWTPCGVYESVFAFQQHRNVLLHGAAATANLAVRASSFALVSGFAEADFLEDYEWCQRARHAGVHLAYVNEVSVAHDPRATFSALAGKWRRHVYQQYMSHRKAGYSRVGFALQSLKVALLTPVMTAYLLTRAEHSLRDRFRAVPILWAIRALRVSEMLQLLRCPVTPRPPWNGLGTH